MQRFLPTLALLALVLSILAAAPAAALGDAIAPPAPSEFDGTTPVQQIPLFDVLDAAVAQAGSGTCNDPFIIDSGVLPCYDGEAICMDACADAGGTYYAWATMKGNDCYCFCCAS